MSNELPFFHIDDNDFEEYLNIDSSKKSFNNHLSDQTFREYLFNLSVAEHFKLLDSTYYTTEHFVNKFKKNKDVELSVFHLNIHSLNSKQFAFCTFMNLLQFEFDVIILSEICTHNIEFYHNILDGFSLFHDLPVNTSVGGVGISVKNSRNCKLRPDLYLSSNSHKLENLWLEISKNKIKYIIGGIYRHPNQKIQEFSDLLEINLSKISKDKSPCIIAGDINIDLLKADTNTNIDNYLNNLIIHSFLPSILFPTRVTKNSSTLIDHIYYYQGCKRKNKLKLSSGSLFSDLSDHLPSFIILSNIKSKRNLADRPHQIVQ